MPSDAELRADLREKRRAFEAMMAGDTPDVTDFTVAYGRYVDAIRAAAHLGPDPVEGALGEYQYAIEVHDEEARALAAEHLDAALRAEWMAPPLDGP